MIQNETSSRVPVLRRVAVLGAGTMGAAIAAHLANAGLRVLLLDLPPKELSPQETAAGVDPQSPQHRNRLALDAIAQLAKHRPAPLFTRTFSARIEAGNFEDDLARLAEMDWVIEVVVERLDIKQSLLSKVETAAGETTIISTNTSGIPIASLCAGHGESFQRRFLGTHFFNPPRYMHLLEIIPGPKTDPELVAKLAAFADERLGKGVVVAKGSPQLRGQSHRLLRNDANGVAHARIMNSTSMPWIPSPDRFWDAPRARHFVPPTWWGWTFSCTWRRTSSWARLTTPSSMPSPPFRN